MKTSFPGDEAQTRREFCLLACRAGLLAAFGATLGGTLAGCEDAPSSPGGGGGGSNLAVIQATASGGTISLTIDSSSPLASVGSAAMVQYSGGNLLVAHTGDAAFAAVTAVCTHQGCTITNFDGSLYTCPCHGSQFRTNGQVAREPASSSLRTFPTQFANGTLTISV